jgi:hypothetical protein
MWNISNRKERISKNECRIAAQRKLNEWKSHTKGKVEGERGKGEIRWQIRTNIFDKD